MNERDYYVFFSYSVGIGPKTFLKLLRYFKTAEKIYNASEKELISVGFKGKSLEKFLESKAEFDFEKYFEKMRKAKVEFIPYGDKHYPFGLKNIDSPPIGLFIKGNKNLLLSKNNISVVGARKITSYGRQVTEALVADLVRNYIVITSGMAMGVDSVSHETAIENKGLTIAVLGCGVDCPYPRENEKLYEKILDANGLIISEYPIGMSANPGTFPARNRIIAGISQAVLVTEASEDSGSLISADYAKKFGKKIFAVPGPINSQMAQGSLKLLKQGAKLVSHVDDVLEELSIKNKVSSKTKNYRFRGLNLEEKKIVKLLENEEMTVDELSKRVNYSVPVIMQILGVMEIKGIIGNINGRYRVI